MSYKLLAKILMLFIKGGILMNVEQFIQALKEQGIELNETQITQFNQVFQTFGRME